MFVLYMKVFFIKSKINPHFISNVVFIFIIKAGKGLGWKKGKKSIIFCLIGP